MCIPLFWAVEALEHGEVLQNPGRLPSIKGHFVSSAFIWLSQCEEMECFYQDYQISFEDENDNDDWHRVADFF